MQKRGKTWQTWIQLIKGLGLLIGGMSVLTGGFLGTAYVTAHIRASDIASVDHRDQKTNTIYLVSNLLHADIAVPVSPELLARFPALRSTPLPLDHPGLKYVLFGWGAKAFYTTAGTYSDIEPVAVYKAVTGDQSVMRVSPAGDLSESDAIVALNLSDNQMERLYNALENSFVTHDTKPVIIDGASLTAYDAFFEGQGHFNIFHPCNQWVNGVLRKVGIQIGIWTPTTHSLLRSVHYLNSK